MSTSETQSASIKELHRSRDDRILAGVAGGLGRYFDLSPAFFRIGFAILTLVGGAGILLYVAAWLVIPDDGESDSIVSEALRRHRDRPWLLAGVALVAIALVSLLAQADFWPNSGFAWALLLLGGLAIMFAQRRTDDGTPPDVSTPLDLSTAPDDSTAPGDAATPAARPRQPSLLLPGLGVLLAAAGALALLDALGVGVRWDVALAVGAIGTGVAVVAGVTLRRRTGGLVVVGLVLAALAVAVSVVDVRLEGPIGTRVYSPFETSDLKRDYDISIGDLKLDLSDAALVAGDTDPAAPHSQAPRVHLLAGVSHTFLMTRSAGGSAVGALLSPGDTETVVATPQESSRHVGQVPNLNASLCARPLDANCRALCRAPGLSAHG